MNLSDHFTLGEATASETAARRGIDNTPDAATIERMKAVCVAILEPVRAHYGKPVHVSSFYRAPALNSAVGSKPTSQHVVGEAVDFSVPGIPNDDVARWVRDNLTYDQLIREFGVPGQPYSGWVHASFKIGGGCRGECLTIDLSGTRPGFLV